MATVKTNRSQRMIRSNPWRAYRSCPKASPPAPGRCFEGVTVAEQATQAARGRAREASRAFRHRFRRIAQAQLRRKIAPRPHRRMPPALLLPIGKKSFCALLRLAGERAQILLRPQRDEPGSALRPRAFAPARFGDEPRALPTSAPRAGRTVTLVSCLAARGSWLRRSHGRPCVCEDEVFAALNTSRSSRWRASRPPGLDNRAPRSRRGARGRAQAADSICGAEKSFAANSMQALWAAGVYAPFQRGESECRDPGSNRGPSDLRSDALPTELSRLHFGHVRSSPNHRQQGERLCHIWAS